VGRLRSEALSITRLEGSRWRGGRAMELDAEFWSGVVRGGIEKRRQERVQLTIGNIGRQRRSGREGVGTRSATWLLLSAHTRTEACFVTLER
jgi:hypothetical protein